MKITEAACNLYGLLNRIHRFKGEQLPVLEISPRFAILIPIGEWTTGAALDLPAHTRVRRVGAVDPIAVKING